MWRVPVVLRGPDQGRRESATGVRKGRALGDGRHGHHVRQWHANRGAHEERDHDPLVVDYQWIMIAFFVGSAIGVPLAYMMPMTAVPQRTAFSHACGALAAALIGTAEY